MEVPSDPKIDNFDILQTIYKTVIDHGIRCDILVPKARHEGKRPVIVNFHGGGLVVGDSLLMFIWPVWLSELALKHGAIIISPNYRLMPEATSTEIYEDVDDFWAWIHTPELADLLRKHTTPAELDLDRIMAIGGSAGGTLSLYLALAHPTEIRSVTAAYPCTDFMTSAYTKPRGGPVWGQNVPESAYHEIMNTADIGAPVSTIVSPERSAFMIACFQHGHLGALYARGAENTPREKLLPIARLEQSGGMVPRGGVVIIQGRQDSVITIAETEKFIKRALELTSPGDIVYVTREGEHGFDLNSRLNDHWLQEALGKAIETWLE
ncbi:hypothetical protein N7481_007906 [Penicillium waksmanii]|uniref:uncharacterized protein n=1 Tax=Penicillium waksmanii TaxID=69791 RepID=UPI0025491D7C|nr:uncharacterized protein N7481_007906 [Penicillium waksmanii]KAJ5980608.1 hypothetical protein N7481_007906 [Penicillium waksmanii]